MKKIIIMMAFVLPISLLAQTRPAPKKSIDKKIEDRSYKAEKPKAYAYITMDVVEIKSKKEPSIMKFKFESFDQKYSDKITKVTQKCESVISVLNILGKKGWELVAVEGQRYYFKNSFVSARFK